jgi:acyl-CoA synthetase (AMP-forming)/AMP-acid ligase II
VINVGGQKVFPERVEAVLREVPGVVLAQVQRKKNSFVGELVEAVVVPSSECGDLVEFRRELVTHCQQRLARHEVPSMIRFAPQLPTTSSGKLVRI